MTKRLPLVLILLSAAAMEATAQVRPDTARRDTTPLAPIVITATRTPEPVGTLGNSVTVLHGDELLRAGITTVADALRAVAGAAVVEQGGPGSVTSLFLRGGQSNYVRVLVDGVPLNEAGGSVNLANVTTANVDRIELVRGPSSVAYGSDAVTGVVQIITRQAPGPVRFSLSARGGSFDSRDAAGELTSGSKRAGLSIGAGRMSSDGFYPFNNDYLNDTESFAGWWRPDDRTDLRVALRSNGSEYHFPTQGSGAATDSNQFQTSRGTTASFDAGRQLTSWLELRTLLGFRESKDIYDDRPDSPADPSTPFHSDVVTDRKSADLRLNFRGGGAIYTLGAVLDDERGRGWNSFGSDGRVERTNRAVYGQVVRAWASGASLQAGARVEDNQTFGTFVTWRAGGSLRLADETRLRVNAGTAFREPTFLENFSSSFSVGNPDLDPERSISLEAGIEHRFAAVGASVSATVFVQRFNDMIQYSPASAPPAPSYYNIAGADASGLETQLSWRPGAALHLRAEYTLLLTSVSDSGFDGQQYAMGDRLIRRPTNSGSLSMDYAPPGRFTVGGRWLLVGTRDDLDFGSFPASRVTLPGYGRVDLWGEVELLRKSTGVALTAKVENVLDQPYQEVYGFPTPGQRLYVGARFSTRQQ